MSFYGDMSLDASMVMMVSETLVANGKNPLIESILEKLMAQEHECGVEEEVLILLDEGMPD